MQNRAQAIDPKASVVEVVARKLPINRLGLPEGIFRPDLLPLPMKQVNQSSPLKSELSTPAAAGVEVSPSSPHAGAPEGASLASSESLCPSRAEDSSPPLPSGSEVLSGTQRDQGSAEGPETWDESMEASLGDLVQDNTPEIVAPEPETVSQQESATSNVPAVAPWDVIPDVGASATVEIDLNEAQKLKERSVLESVSAEHLQNAFVPVVYSEGFPTLEDGTPFWEQFEWEGADAFRALKHYIRMGKKGARQLYKLWQRLQDSADFRGAPPSLAEVKSWHIIYFWSWRSQAHDMFAVAHQRKSDSHTIQRIENKHRKFSAQLMEQLQRRMMDNSEGLSDEFWETMNAPTMVKLLSFVAQWQRISAGLPANGPSGTAVSPQSTGIGQTQSVAAIIQQLASGLLSDAPGLGGSDGKLIDEHGNEIAELTEEMLADPAKAMQAQELIISITKRKLKGVMPQAGAGSFIKGAA